MDNQYILNIFLIQYCNINTVILIILISKLQYEIEHSLHPLAF